MFFLLSFFACLLLPFASQASASDDGFISTPLDSCFTTEAAWLGKRASLRKSDRITDLLGLGELAERCAHEPSQMFLFSRPSFAACFDGLRSFARFAVESTDGDAAILKLQRVPLAPKEAVRLPIAFKDEAFWLEISSRDSSRIRLAILGVVRGLPGAVAFRYTSVLQPNSPLYLVYYREVATGFERFVHFDQDLNINLLTITGDRSPQFVLAHLSRDDLIKKPRNLGEALQPGDLSNNALTGEITTNSARCYRCHQAPVLPIFPSSSESVEVFAAGPKGEAPLSWFNFHVVRTEGVGLSSLATKLPRLGDPGVLSKQFLERCSGLKGQLNLTRLREGLKCASCHDDHTVPVLTFPFGNPALVEGGAVGADLHFDQGVSPHFHTMAAVPQLYVEKGHMPPDIDTVFGELERRALFRCLMTEFMGRLYPDRPATFASYEGRLVRSLLQGCSLPATKKGPRLRKKPGPSK